MHKFSKFAKNKKVWTYLFVDFVGTKWISFYLYIC